MNTTKSEEFLRRHYLPLLTFESPLMTTTLPHLDSCTVAVIGLGYVGLPLAVQFAKKQSCCRTGQSLHRRVIGFDINSERLEELRQGNDRTNEISSEELQEAQNLEFTRDASHLSRADVFVVTVPTPIDSAKRPDFTPLEMASTTVGNALKYRSSTTTPLVIYESTVYPGATEEVCVPILERTSGLVYNEGFFCGYSPERINPGDNEHKIATIIKVTSGSSPKAAAWVDCLYGSIIKAGTHLAPSMKVAEAAKVIENTQRDLNIALVNELAIIFRHIGVDTLDVLEAAATKWNFLPFRPGLVGGHCIGVDPYYLTHKAEQLGYHPQVVLAGRRINDSMGRWLAEQLVLTMAKRSQRIVGARVLVLGLTFKENCPDLRNTKVIDFIKALQQYNIVPTVVDPWVDLASAKSEYNIDVYSEIPDNSVFDAVAFMVSHRQFSEIKTAMWEQILAKDGIVFDIKGNAPRDLNPIRL